MTIDMVQNQIKRPCQITNGAESQRCIVNLLKVAGRCSKDTFFMLKGIFLLSIHRFSVFRDEQLERYMAVLNHVSYSYVTLPVVKHVSAIPNSNILKEKGDTAICG